MDVEVGPHGPLRASTRRRPRPRPDHLHRLHRPPPPQPQPRHRRRRALFLVAPAGKITPCCCSRSRSAQKSPLLDQISPSAHLGPFLVLKKNRMICVEVLIALCASAGAKQERLLASGLKALSSLLWDVGSTEKFRQNQGPKIVMDILKEGSKSSDILDAGFSVVAAGSAGNEVVKESFMDLKTETG